MTSLSNSKYSFACQSNVLRVLLLLSVTNLDAEQDQGFYNKEKHEFSSVQGHFFESDVPKCENQTACMVTLDADYFLTAGYSADRLQDLFISKLKNLHLCGNMKVASHAPIRKAFINNLLEDDDGDKLNIMRADDSGWEVQRIRS